MNDVNLNIGFNNRIEKTYLVGKYSKTLFENSDDAQNYSPKIRNGVIISISDKAKKFYAKAQQVHYTNAAPVSKKSETKKTLFEKVNNDKDSVKEKSKARKRNEAYKRKFSELYDTLTTNLEKGGFVVSGNIFATVEKEEKTAADKLREIFEIEDNRAPGLLVNVVV